MIHYKFHIKFLLFAILFFGTAEIFAAEGDLDSSFDGDGIVTTDNNLNSDSIRDLAVQPDGKIIAVGISFESSASSQRAVIARYLPDGSVDATFGTSGKVIIPSVFLEEAALQTNGKIVLAGNSGTPTNSDFYIARLNSDGSFDATFNGTGAVTLDLRGFSDRASAVKIQSDGKILSGGNITSNSGNDFMLARFLASSCTTNCPGAKRKAVADFDGDGKTDVSVFRPSNGFWYISKSSGGYSFLQWGTSIDLPVPGDYDGDGKADLAVYRKSADSTWYILRSSDNTFLAKQWGATNLESNLILRDTPMPADYDGDGKTDLTVYRLTDAIGETGRFVVLQSLTDSRSSTDLGNHFFTPVPADYDGDGRTDYAIFRGGVWSILQNSSGTFRTEYFGLATDKLVPGDYDGDGRADIAVWRPSNGYWYWISSCKGSFNSIQFGLSDDKPVPGDYDGDGKTDFAVFRPSNGVWYLQQSSSGFRAEQFGLPTDIPLPNVFVR